MILSESIERFFDQLRANGCSPLTIDAYSRDLGLLVKFASDIEIDQLTPDLINRFVISDGVQLKSNGERKAEVSISRIKAAIKSFGRFLADVGATNGNPARTLQVKRTPRKDPAFLTPEEQKLMKKNLAIRKGSACARDVVMLKLFLGTGIRLSELVNIDLADLKLDDKKLIVKVKGGRTETRFLNTELRKTLQKYLRARRKILTDSQALFLSDRRKRISTRQVQGRFKLWLSWAGIDRGGLTVHSLRHSFATNLYSRTRNLVLTSRALGHAQVTTTTIYTHLFDHELEDALESL